MKIDMIEGTARVACPATKKEKAEHDWFVEWREMFEDELSHLQVQRADATNTRQVDQLDEEIGQIRRILEITDMKLSD
jgi:hypothetical protein